MDVGDSAGLEQDDVEEEDEDEEEVEEMTADSFSPTQVNPSRPQTKLPRLTSCFTTGVLVMTFHKDISPYTDSSLLSLRTLSVTLQISRARSELIIQ